MARALFFARTSRDGDSNSLSDEACRAARATKITGVNYDKFVRRAIASSKSLTSA